MTGMEHLKYTVREPGKTGGREYLHVSEAVKAALKWYDDTGIACEIWASVGERKIRSSVDSPPKHYIREKKI